MLLTRKNNKWAARYYTFTTFPLENDSIKVQQKETVKLDYDSLYKQLVNDGLLTLNSDTINNLLDKRGLHRYMWTDA